MFASTLICLVFFYSLYSGGANNQLQSQEQSGTFIISKQSKFLAIVFNWVILALVGLTGSSILQGNFEAQHRTVTFHYTALRRTILYLKNHHFFSPKADSCSQIASSRSTER
jgi:hypothetical protein